MYVRCPGCDASSRLGLGHNAPTATCTQCGKDLSLHRVGELGSTPHDRYQAALDFSAQHQIDLASSYSVLLGLLSLEVAQAKRESETDESPPPPEPASAKPTEEVGPTADSPAEWQRRLGYDRAFYPAVKAGRLTPREAAVRGDRVAFATRLARNHRIAMRWAFMVADNELSLVDARRRSRDPGSGALLVASAVRSGSGLVAWAIFAVLFATVAVVGGIGVRYYVPQVTAELSAAPESVPAPARRVAAERLRVRAGTESRVNAEGEPTFVAGPSPQAVLETFCSLARKGQRRAIRVAPSPEGWDGFYRDAGTTHSIAIRKAADGGRWIAGDGSRAIVDLGPPHREVSVADANGSAPS